MIRATTSASNLFRRELCPGSADAEAQFKPEVDEDSEYSLEGTTLHSHAADPSLDRSGLKGEQVDVLRTAADGDRQIIRLIHEAKGLPEDEPFEEGHEREMWLRRGIKNLLPGHCDYWRYYPRFKLLVIIDYKFGRLTVTSAEKNVQLRAYAVMATRDFDVETAMVCINQPRLAFDERITIAQYERDAGLFPSASLAAAKDHLFAIWDGAYDAKGQPRTDVPRVAGEDQCRYCAARVNCDAYRAKFETLAVAAPDGADAFIGRLARATPEQLDAAWQAFTFVKLIAEPLKAEIVRRLEAGEMPMYETRSTGATSKIVDPVKARAALKRLGMTDAELDERAKYSFEPLEELYRLNNGCTAVAAKKTVREALAGVLEITPKTPSLVRKKGWVPLPAATSGELA